MKLDKEDLDAIADAVAAKLKAPAAAPSTGKAAEKPETAAEKKKRLAAEAAEAANDGPKREAVLAKVKELGDAKGRDVVKNLISKYGESFGKVADSDLAGLMADLEALESAEEAPAGDEY